MNVYVLTEEQDEEPGTMLGAYTTLENAHKAAPTTGFSASGTMFHPFGRDQVDSVTGRRFWKAKERAVHGPAVAYLLIQEIPLDADVRR